MNYLVVGRERRLKFELELVFLIGKVVENVRGNTDDGDPHTEHGHMGL